MAVTVNAAKANKDIFKKVLNIRPVYAIFKRQYSQKDDLEKFFKFYSDSGELDEKSKPLSENDYKRFISLRSSKREPALTRQITSLSYKVGKQVLSLAEGMPNEEAFPYSKLSLELQDGRKLVLEGSELGKALQYVPSQGLPSLLTELRQFQQDLHRPPPLPRDILVTNGGQHGIYQCIELLLEPGDPIITTQYAYTGLHSTLKPYNPELLGIPEDDNGMVPETLDSILGDRLKSSLKMPKFLYIIPTGSNPTGTVLPEERRREIYKLACKYDFLILEDDPYMFLNYGATQVPSFLSLDTCGRVIRIDSISKVVSAGLRGGWVTAPKALLDRLELHSQAELLHSCTLAQVVSDVLRGGWVTAPKALLDRLELRLQAELLHSCTFAQAIILHLVSDRASLHTHLLSARALYRRRRDALHSALREVQHMTHCPLPDAGLFFWMKVHGVEDVYNMVFQTALQRGLMLIPGQAFSYDTRAPCQYLRLTFSKIRFEDMKTAIGHLAEIIRDEQRRTAEKRTKVAT